MTSDVSRKSKPKTQHPNSVIETATARSTEATRFDDKDHQRLLKLRARRIAERNEPPSLSAVDLTIGQRIADQVAATMGSWPFIIVQSTVLLIWIGLNVTAYIARWDPYPFILLNLVLSFQAAYAAPVIMMSQNRQQDVDRREAANDYHINVKAELEIELLHDKIDALREQEVLALTKAVQTLTEQLEHRDRKAVGQSAALTLGQPAEASKNTGKQVG
jgi:uncharacterized membrane protein